MGNTYNRVYIWCCKYGENRYHEICANKKWCASKHTSLLNSCLGKLCLHPYLVVPLISARITLISTRVSAHCQAILLKHRYWKLLMVIVKCLLQGISKLFYLLNLRALAMFMLIQNDIFQCLGKIFCVEFQRYPLKFDTNYIKNVYLIYIIKLKSCYICQLTTI